MAKRILLTGMSGTGKSTVLAEMAARGYQTVDMDADGWCEYTADGAQLWNEDRLQARLSTLGADEVLFVSGCAENQGKFYAQFDRVILLSAPRAVIVARLQTRTNNPYGKDPAELNDVLGYMETVEPLLRKGADVEIDTSAPLAEVVQRVLALVEETSG